MPPTFVAWVRVALAAAVLLVLAQRAGVLGTDARHLDDQRALSDAVFGGFARFAAARG